MISGFETLFFGMARSHNDIYILQRSLVFLSLAKRNAPECNYEINDHEYTKRYYLADGIYPEWSTFNLATFVNTISISQGNKRSTFVSEYKSCKKNVERTFGVLQSCWAIV